MLPNAFHHSTSVQIWYVQRNLPIVRWEPSDSHCLISVRIDSTRHRTKVTRTEDHPIGRRSPGCRRRTEEARSPAESAVKLRLEEETGEEPPPGPHAAGTDRHGTGSR